jgi:hypothetical protein
MENERGQSGGEQRALRHAHHQQHQRVEPEEDVARHGREAVAGAGKQHDEQDKKGELERPPQ